MTSCKTFMRYVTPLPLSNDLTSKYGRYRLGSLHIGHQSAFASVS